MSVSDTSERILVVDDFHEGLVMLERVLSGAGYSVETADSGSNALKSIHREPPALVVLDINMPDIDGYEITHSVKEDRELRRVPIILLTSKDTPEDIVYGLEQGADDYITKPFHPEELLARVAATLRMKKLYEQFKSTEAKNRELLETISSVYGAKSIIGKSAAIQNVLELIQRVAAADSPVLITGASGTGKELVARALHYGSLRSGNTFVAKNCAGFQEELMEAEIFGYVRGAFTGAFRDTRGLIEAAQGGTLFLDEVSEMPVSLQAKLLRVLQEGTYSAVGSTTERKANVRFVAATHRNLEAMIEAGTFREDLYYRLNVVNIDLPSLADRREDIPLLIEHFLVRRSQLRGGNTRMVSEKALEILCNHNWRGNVRELENEIERMLVLASDEGVLGHDLLSPRVLAGQAVAPSSNDSDGSQLRVALDGLERQLIADALTRAAGNKSKAARILGISRSNLISKVQAYKLEQ